MTTTATPTMPGPATSFDRDRAPLDDAAQGLIDARLETIERMLFGQTPRADRLAIVREVESQIHELLAQRDPSDTDRDAVIAALARLDPPEAYLSDEAGAIARPRSTAGSARLAHLPSSSRPVPGRRILQAGRTAAIVSGITGISSIILAILSAALFSFIYGTTVSALAYVFNGLLHFGFATSIIALTLAAVVRVQHVWAIVGLVTGTIGLLATGPFVIFLLG